MSKSHWANIILSFLAFSLFVVNVFFELAGWGALDLRGPLGAGILTGFLSIGLIIQVAKIIEGHRSRMDLLITGVLLPFHVIAELAIWVRTQIMGLSLPENLPFIAVGVYWSIGLVDVLARYIGREMKVFGGGFEAPEIRVIRLEKENALLLQQQSTTQALLEQRISSAEAMLKQREALLDEQKAQQSVLYEETCSFCGVVFAKNTPTAARNALNGHINRKHNGKVPALPAPQTTGEPKSPSEGF